MPRRASDDGLNPGQKLFLVERLGQVVVGAGAQSPDLVLGVGQARQDQDRGLHAAVAKPAQNLESIDVGQHDVENDNVVIIEFADFQPILAEIGRIDDHAGRFKYQFYALLLGGVVFDKKNAHVGLPTPPLTNSLTLCRGGFRRKVPAGGALPAAGRGGD